MVKSTVQAFVNRITAVSLVGVDLGSSALKAVEVERSNGRVRLRRCAVVPVEEGNVTAALNQLVSRAGIAAAHVAVGLASPEVIVKPVQFPPMPPKELRSAVRLEAEQAILNGHTLNEMALDWHPLASPSKDLLRGLLAVVPQDAVSARLHIAEAAGLRPAVVDVEGLALWNAYWVLIGSQEAASKTVLLMNVGAKTTNLVIAKGPDELILIRDLQLGAGSLQHGQAPDWMTEVRDSLGYARAQGGLRALDAVYVTGGGAGPDLLPSLTATVAAPVTFWNPLNQLARDTESAAVEDSLGPLLAIAIGLALRQPS